MFFINLIIITIIKIYNVLLKYNCGGSVSISKNS